MYFQLTAEQKMMAETISEFAQNEIAPKAADHDETAAFPSDNLKKMAAQDLMGIPVPEKWGGAGLDALMYVIAIEEISRACASTGVILSVHTSVGTLPILMFGTEKQKQKYVTKLAQGQMLGAFALTEPQAGSDAASISTSAVDKGDHYVLNGTKVFITSGGHADTYVTFAVTDREKGVRGISAFIVERDTPGFKIGTVEKKMGLNSSATAELIFDNAIVAKDNLLGVEGQGFKIAMANLDIGRIGIGAQAVGIGQAALSAALEYAKGREQFGKPIAKLAAIQNKLAQMGTEIEAARLLVYRAANLKDQGMSFAKEASMAKMFAADAAVKAATEAIQILGGYGYSREYPVERFFRDAKATQIYEGTNEVQRLVIAKHLIK